MLKYICTSMYADDTSLSVTGSLGKNTETRINDEVQNVHDWFKENILILNVKKTEYMIYKSFQH